jgi:hypothetical protein
LPRLSKRRRILPFRPIYPPDEKRRPRDPEFGSYACSACGPPGRAANEIKVRHQSEDSQGARDRPSPTLLALAEFAAALESLRGTLAKCRRVRKVVAIKGKAEVARTSRFGSEGPRADMARVASNVRFQLCNEIALLFER